MSAAVGNPGTVSADVVVWPWRIRQVQPARNQMPPRPGSIGSRALPALRLDAYFVLLTEGDLPNLVRAAQCLHDSPVLAVGGARYALNDHELSEDLQISLLSAAGALVQPIMSYVASRMD